ncbi:MAG: bifunctional aspartate kinase/homoserine dehydrogenase I [Gemmatimonadota bacterium]
MSGGIRIGETVDEGKTASREGGDRSSIRVLKFGGTSLANEERFASVVRRVSEVLADGRRPIVVVSAVGGTTDALQTAAAIAGSPSGSGEGSVFGRSGLVAVEENHLRLLEVLAPAEELAELRGRVHGYFRDIERLIQGVELLGECSPRTKDRLLSHGELLSALLVAAGLRSHGLPGRAVDARQLIRTDDRHGSALVDREVSTRQIRERLADAEDVPVVTGFVAATADGETTTLGRGASDFTATLIGAALRAEVVEIWTDVGGIHTADPRSVPLAAPIGEVSYEELLELASFGAKVMCPLAVEPVRDAGIPVRILSTLDPSLPGTRVVENPVAASGPVRGISAIREAALIRLEGVERLGVSETAERLFRALRGADVPALLFTVDSSAHSVSLAVAAADLSRTEAAIRKEFDRERKAGLLGDPVSQEGRSILAIVGEGMRDTPGISGRLFRTLGELGVNVHAIAQGSSERNISWVVAQEDEPRALRAVHDAFLAGSPGGNGTSRVDVHPPQPLPISVLGAGRVGGELLDQLRDHGLDELRAQGFDPRLVGVARSRGAALDPAGLDPSSWRDHLHAAEAPPDEVVAAVSGEVPGLLVDCTASGEVAGLYVTVLRAGGGVITANKLPLAGSLSTYRELRDAAGRGIFAPGGGLHYEATVGAGLPVLSTLSDLRASGDELRRLEGVLSGSLSFIFQGVNEGAVFSEIVREAVERGLTEPHPGEDLGLRDVVRKLVILGREWGRPLEADDVEVTPILPSELLAIADRNAFLDALREIDGDIADRRAAAEAEGARLIPVARLDESGPSVGLRAVASNQPLAQLRPGDNVVEMETVRYSSQPLVIQGPGAGTEVTAAGLLVDLLRAARQLSMSRARDRTRT